MDFTYRSYGFWSILLVKSLVANCYVPLTIISLKKFLYGEYFNYPNIGSIDIDFDNLVNQKMQQFNLTFELEKIISPCIIWIPSIHELNVNDLTNSFLYLDLTKSFLGLLANHLSRDDEKDSIRNIVFIALTHVPPNVDTTPIAPNQLDRLMNI
jgi:hypothetical protein